VRVNTFVPSVKITLNGAVPTVKLKVSGVVVPIQIEVVPEINPLGEGLTVTISATEAEQLFAVPVIV
jgi:hypothetical protein